MLSLIISFLVLFLGLSGAILSVSGMLNSYQKKKLEYIAYTNQGKAKYILDDADGATAIDSETEYYKSHDLLSAPVIDINFISRDFGANFLKLETYTDFAKASLAKTISFFENLDLALITTQSKVWLGKTGKFVKIKYSELSNFLLKITQPIENKNLDPDHSSVRSAMATSSRIKNLNQTFQNISHKGQEFVKSRFSKPKTQLHFWPNLSEEIDLDQKHTNKPSDSVQNKSTLAPKPDTAANLETSVPTAPSPKLVDADDEYMYQELEDQILEKLHQNLNDFELWESLGNFYTYHKENEKAKEVYSYINKHSKNKNQLARLGIKN